MQAPPANGAIYPYLDHGGQRLYSVVRHVPKRFELLGPNDRTLERFPDRTVLYRLPELLKSDAEELVYLCEGEKDADRLRGLGLVATTNPGGCRLGWKAEYTPCLKDRTVVILADNDKPGARLSESIHTALNKAKIPSGILHLPRLRRAEDVSDWLDYRKGTLDELYKCVAKLFASSRPAPPPDAGGHHNRHKIFTSRFSTSQRMILLAIHHYSGTGGRNTVGELAKASGLHRVTAQGILGELQKWGFVERISKRWTIHFDRIV